MAMSAVLATIQQRLADPTTGLAVKAAARATALGYQAGRVRTDFVYEKWSLSGQMREATATTFAIAPDSFAAPEKRFTSERRDSRLAVLVSCQVFDGDVDSLQDNIVAVSEAFIQCMDDLVAFSTANGGTIVNLEDPITVTFTDFNGEPTQGGFLAQFTVFDRSTI